MYFLPISKNTFWKMYAPKIFYSSLKLKLAGLANYSLPSVFVNKGLLEPSHAHSFIFCL